MQLSEPEAKEFAKAAANVARHYSTQTTQKTIDFIALAGIMGGVYGTRLMAISERRKDEKRNGGGDRGKVLHFRPRNGARPQVRSVEDVEEPALVPDVASLFTGDVHLSENGGDEHEGF